ncbi:hypothetical protein SYNTR_0208 [Candidatus Syntrophocurvum alkaliphilum]|uniref:Uncharacterized protein n=1 Tax=Candidatus Syntrophocurvum alkaliphilum TaxID=2293317 RepID=A0A6I6DE55_9FIRM|nr:hypothetical protein [Candidatus Syntrophocurvum alkaliphilum]QGT98801.1 hypothetical protein SYNTR_0208 [Candidatus Syntrophocurvum alkaliphilum]
MSNNTKIYLIIILLFTTTISGFMLYQEKKNNQWQYEGFLNRFYFELMDTISLIDSTVSKDLDEDRLTKNLININNNLERLHLSLDIANRSIHTDIRRHTRLFAHHPVTQFAENGQLDEDEKRYLLGIKEFLESIHKGLYSEETNQENPNISIEEFNEIIENSTNSIVK